MGCRSLKICKSGVPFVWSHTGISFQYETRKFLWGGDEMDAATVGACWSGYFDSDRVSSSHVKKYFIESNKRWGRGLRQFDT